MAITGMEGTESADGAAKAGKATAGTEVAVKGKIGMFEYAKVKAGAKGFDVSENGDGTYTVAGKTAGKAWSKTYVDLGDSPHIKNQPDQAYVNKVKSFMQKQAGQDQIGQDSNGDNTYGGKSLELNAGGRTKLLHDRITWELVQKGYSHEDASRIASQQTKANYLHKYGANDQLRPDAAKDMAKSGEPGTAGVKAA